MHHPTHTTVELCYQRFRFRQRWCERLLTEDCNALVRRHAADLRVELTRCRDVDRIDLDLGEHFLHRCKNGGNAVLRGSRFRCAKQWISNRDYHSTILQRCPGVEMMLRHPARTSDSYTQHTHGMRVAIAARGIQRMRSGKNTAIA